MCLSHRHRRRRGCIHHDEEEEIDRTSADRDDRYVIDEHQRCEAERHPI